MKKAILIFGLLSVELACAAAQYPILVCYHGQFNEFSYEVFAEEAFSEPNPEVTLIKTKSVPGFNVSTRVAFPNLRARHDLWNGQTFIAFTENDETQVLKYNPLGASTLKDSTGSVLLITCKAKSRARD